MLKKNDNTWCLWAVDSKKWIFLLKSARIIFMIPLAIFESRVSNSIWCLPNTSPEWSNSSIHAATWISANQQLINRGWVHPDITQSKNRINSDACGQSSNSNVSAFFPFWRTFIGNWSRVRQSRSSRWNMLPWVAFCVWSGIDQAARHPPANGCVRGLTPTSCAARTWRWSPGWGSTGWREERRERSELDVGRRHQRHKMRMRVRDGYEWCGHNFISSHGVPSVCSREKVCCDTLQEVYSVYTSVAFSDLRLTGRKNATILEKNLDGDQRSRISSWMFSWSILLSFPWASLYFKNCFIDYPWSDHLSSCQLLLPSFPSLRPLVWAPPGCWRPLRRRRWGWDFAFFCGVLLPHFPLAIPGTHEF